MVVSNETAREIIEPVMIGWRVAVVVPSVQRGRELLIDLVDAIPLEPRDYKVYTSKLEIRIGPVGRVTIHSIRSSSSLRGMSLDRSYLEHDVDDEDVLAAIMPTLNARGGDLVRY